MTNKSLTNYGKAYWTKSGDTERVYVNVDRYSGETVKLSPRFLAKNGTYEVVGYVDVVRESFPSDWDTTYWEDFAELVMDHLEEIGAIEYDEAFARLVK